jgi:hypothetical protein
VVLELVCRKRKSVAVVQYGVTGQVADRIRAHLACTERLYDEGPVGCEGVSYVILIDRFAPRPWTELHHGRIQLTHVHLVGIAGGMGASEYDYGCCPICMFALSWDVVCACLLRFHGVACAVRLLLPVC